MIKKLIPGLALLALVAACDDDHDSNPVLTEPTAFTLNAPAVASGTIDLARSKSVTLSWSQPQYTAENAPVVATYSVQLSPTGSFQKAFDTNADDNTGADYITLDETYTKCQADVPTEAIAKALVQLTQWTEADVPATQDVAIRVKSAVRNATFEEFGAICSNTVTLTTIPYYIELMDADPLLWYLIGGDIGDGKWGGDIPTSTFPMQPQKDYEFDKKTGEGELTWTGYVAGNGFKLKLPDGWDFQWGSDGGDGFVENDGGSANIVRDPGVYTVTLNTQSHKLSVEPYEGTATVYPVICVTGSFNDWSDTDMQPIHTYDGAQNHDWTTTLDLAAGAEVKFKIQGSWDTNWGGDALTVSNGVYGYGAGNGANIVVPNAGKYLVIFNDITGFYRLIAQ